MNSGVYCAFAAVALLAGGAAAAGTGLSEAQLRYQNERAACLDGTSNQDRATCLKEAAAAWREVRRGGLSTAGDASLSRNRLDRCAALPAPDREDCAMRMHQGKTSGSAQQGGILREMERPVAPR